ncbi:MAG: hypothetical protein P4L56_06675 [Candidatus Sulfopaludibacter sp.]|nr:hypothetical protein [Candidatus Sulfopaludibacter sp.]
MTVSLEDAVRLLMKWKTEETPVGVVVIAGALSTSFSGFISDCSPDAFTVINLTGKGERLAELTAGIRERPTFEYKEVREAQEHMRARLAGKIASALTIRMDSGLECTLYEFIG